MDEARLKQIEQALTVGGPFGSDPTFAKATVRDLVAEVRCLQRVADERQQAVDRLQAVADAAVDAAEIVRQWHANPRPAVHWKPFLEAVDAYRAAGGSPREEPCSDAYVAGLLAEVRRMRDRELAGTIYGTSRKAEGGAASPTVVEVRQEGNPRPELTDAEATELRRKVAVGEVELSHGASPIPGFADFQRPWAPKAMEVPREARDVEAVEALAPYVKRLEGRVARLEARLTADADEEQVLSALSEMQAAFLRRFETMEAEAAVVSRYVSGLTTRVEGLESQEAPALPEDAGAAALLARVRAFLCAVNAERVAMPAGLLDEAKALREALG